MRSTLVDAGPCIALFDRNEAHHAAVQAFISQCSLRLVTTWPVVTEVVHMLDFDRNAQLFFLEWLARGAVHIVTQDREQLTRIIELHRKYADLPIDLADASLITLAESLDTCEIITLDSDYYVYRTKNKRHFKNLLEPYLGKRR